MSLVYSGSQIQIIVIAPGISIIRPTGRGDNFSNRLFQNDLGSIRGFLKRDHVSILINVIFGLYSIDFKQEYCGLIPD